MAEEPQTDPTSDEEWDEEEDGPPTTPFDHPAFLPVLLIGFTIWFGYDGWFNPDMEWIKFNRYGFGFLLGPAIYSLTQVQKDRPLGTPLIFAANALWLGYMGWLGDAGAWYNDGDETQLFNRYAAGLAALLAVVTWFRARRKMRAAESASAGE